MNDTENAYGDYEPTSEFPIGDNDISNERLFWNVIEYGLSFHKNNAICDREIIHKEALDKIWNDWIAFHLITKGVTNKWSVKTLQWYFGNKDVEKFIKKRKEILSDAAKIGKNAEQYLNEIESGSSTGENEEN